MKTICPHCNQEYPETPDEYLGKTCECAACHKDFVVEKVRFCRRCGTANAAKAAMCSLCRSRFDEGSSPSLRLPPSLPAFKLKKNAGSPPPAPAVAPRPQEEVRKPSGPPEKRKKRGIWDLVSVLLCIVGLCIYHANKADKWKKTSSPPAKQADHQPGKYEKNTFVSSNVGQADFEKGERFYYDETNHQEAVRWYRKAADQGHIEAQLALGQCYRSGFGVEKDENEAIRWFSNAVEQCRQAADQGNAEAQLFLGKCYMEGWGVKEDKKEAVRWYRKAADQGFARAQYELGFCYNIGENQYYGYGVKKDDKEAARWYRKAADQGYAKAQYALGKFYAGGFGVEKDNREAVRWYRKAADQEHAEAELALGDCYTYGWGVPKDYEEAYRWYRKVASRNDRFFSVVADRIDKLNARQIDQMTKKLEESQKNNIFYR